MTIGDSLHYITIGNPVSKAVISTTSSLFSRGATSSSNAATVKASTDLATRTMGSVMPPLWKLAGRHHNFVRLAGVCGASAVILGAIGSHKLNALSDKGEAKTIFDTANRFHFIHSLALLGMPLAKYPVVTGTLMVTGIVMFSGVLYYRAFTGNRRLAGFAPFGGTCLIVAWLSLIL